MAIKRPPELEVPARNMLLDAPKPDAEYIGDSGEAVCGMLALRKNCSVQFVVCCMRDALKPVRSDILEIRVRPAGTAVTPKCQYTSRNVLVLLRSASTSGLGANEPAWPRLSWLPCTEEPFMYTSAGRATRYDCVGNTLKYSTTSAVALSAWCCTVPSENCRGVVSSTVLASSTTLAI
jgi:hypothetical protein